MKLNYKNQLILSCGIIVAANILNALLKHWIFTSIGWCLGGLLWVIHPVVMGDVIASKKELLAIRCAGGVLILAGLFTRSYLY